MERSQIYEFAPIIILFSWMMVVVPLFPFEYRYFANVGGMMLCIGIMVVVNEILKYKAAGFKHIDATCRPSGQRLHIFVDALKTVELEPGIYATQLLLGDKLKHEIYGTLETGASLVIKHELQWEARMLFNKGKAVFKDQVVDHPASCKVTLYEPPEVFDMDHLNPVPIFYLKEAPGDYLIREELAAVAATSGFAITKPIFAGGQNVTGAKLLFEYNKVVKKAEGLVSENVELKRQALSWHQRAVRLEEVNKQLKNELHAVLSSKSDQKQSVIEQVLTALEAHTKIRNALKALRPTPWLTRAVVIMLLGVLTLGVFISNPGDILGWLAIKENQFFIIILFAIVGFIVYLWKAKGRGR